MKLSLLKTSLRALAGVLFLSPALALAGPSDDEALSDPRVGEKVDRICFSSGINGFRDWKGGDGLILKKGASKEYLVLISRGCSTLDDAMRLGTDERFGGGCIRRSDSLYISDRMFSGRAGADPFSIDRCRISAIYEWNEDAAEGKEEE